MLLCLANYANEKDLAWPGYELIAEQTGIASDATISKTITGLVKKGLISKTNRYISLRGAVKKNSNLYQLLVNISDSSANEVTGDFADSSANEVTEKNSDSSANEVTGDSADSSIPVTTAIEVTLSSAIEDKPTKEPTNEKTSSQDASHQEVEVDLEGDFLRSKNGKLKWAPNDMIAAEWMLRHAERVTGRVKPDREKTLESFANEFRVFREVERLSLTEIFKPFHWVLNTKKPFWRTTIQSPSGLRKNFDQISAQMLEDKNYNTAGGEDHGHDDDAAIEQHLRNLQAECDERGECFDAEFTEL